MTQHTLPPSLENLQSLAPGLPYPLLRLANTLGYGKLADAFMGAAIDRLQNPALRPFQPVLERLRISYDIQGATLGAIPSTGTPLVVVANHPYGLADGLIAGDIISRVRRDFKIVANPIVAGRGSGYDPHLLPINPKIKTLTQHAQRTRVLLSAMHHLQGGGCVVIFPSGSVARPAYLGAPVTDAPWRDFAAYMVAKIRGPVSALPLHFLGTNSMTYEMLHTLGLKGPTRIAMMAHETLRLAGKTLEVRMGQAITKNEMPALEQKNRRIERADLKQLTGFLRAKTLGL